MNRTSLNSPVKQLRNLPGIDVAAVIGLLRSLEVKHNLIVGDDHFVAARATVARRAADLGPGDVPAIGLKGHGLVEKYGIRLSGLALVRDLIGFSEKLPVDFLFAALRTDVEELDFRCVLPPTAKQTIAVLNLTSKSISIKLWQD
jgi:hypothetical protein